MDEERVRYLCFLHFYGDNDDWREKLTEEEKELVAQWDAKLFKNGKDGEED